MKFQHSLSHKDSLGFPKAGVIFMIQVNFKGQCLGVAVSGCPSASTLPQHIPSVLLAGERREGVAPRGPEGNNDSGARGKLSCLSKYPMGLS